MSKRHGLIALNTRLKVGNPGNSGGGNKPQTYKMWLASLLTSEKHRKEFMAVIQDKSHPAFMAATVHAARYAVGLPTQAIELTTPDPESNLTGEERRMRLLGAIPVLIQTLPASMSERAKLLGAIQQVETVMEGE